MFSHCFRAYLQLFYQVATKSETGIRKKKDIFQTKATKFSTTKKKREFRATEYLQFTNTSRMDGTHERGVTAFLISFLIFSADLTPKQDILYSCF